ncbi:MAG: hypothetical protein M3460_12265 [Actinomycetota bacterium]|nr:hypothetical protein [Actinomycetota bacterium]
MRSLLGLRTGTVGQRVGLAVVRHDFQAQAHRIAEGMEVPMVRIVLCGRGWIKVVLLDHDPLSTAIPCRHD